MVWHFRINASFLRVVRLREKKLVNRNEKTECFQNIFVGNNHQFFLSYFGHAFESVFNTCFQITACGIFKISWRDYSNFFMNELPVRL